MASSLLTFSILMYLLVDVMHIWYLSAFILLTIGMTFYNFLSHKRWTFKENSGDNLRSIKDDG